MQLIKNIPQEKSLKNTLRSKKIFGDELLRDWGYIGTVVNGTASNLIKNYFKNSGNQEEKG
jgi:putative transposase